MEIFAIVPPMIAVAPCCARSECRNLLSPGFGELLESDGGAGEVSSTGNHERRTQTALNGEIPRRTRGIVSPTVRAFHEGLAALGKAAISRGPGSSPNASDPLITSFWSAWAGSRPRLKRKIAW